MVTLNRPEEGNAVDRTMHEELLREAAHQMPLAPALEARAFLHPDVTEGTWAFLDERAPTWPGATPEPGAREALYRQIVARVADVSAVPLFEREAVSTAMLYLCSEDGRYVTGQALAVDAGFPGL